MSTLISTPKEKKIEATATNDKLTLKCPLLENANWYKDTEKLPVPQSTVLELDLWSEPRGVYSCSTTDYSDSIPHIDVYVRKCLNCVEMDAATISGFVVADVIMIGLIAMAVYFVSGSETRRPGRGSDKQNLIESEPDYQRLGPRQNDPYSVLASRQKRNAI
ncbi:T-cell surface glycoprotein CD3 gamma chain-like isoform X2 [Hyperolius riggenbachi]|uniref:T-cell surface glycoprotein CD3 gamma chain-like isoform X2 n=1 Tax=Hyperolius riggenbachi TaxID=752182 RepID=UPI0035A392A3